MLPVWPAKINNLAEQGNWGLTPNDGKSIATTDMDNGMSRSRRRFTRTLGKTTFAIDMSDDELDRFNAFCHEELKDHTLWFIMPIFMGGVYREHIVKFDPASLPTVGPAGYRRVSVSISLIINKVFLISEASFYLFDTYSGDTLASMFALAEQFTTETYPNFTERF